MNSDGNPRSGQMPLPGSAESGSAEGWAPLPGSSQRVPGDRTGQSRTEGLRRVRRMSNWTAAALIVGTGATTIALAHHAVPISAPVAASASSSTGTSTAGTTSMAATKGTSGPQVSHSVATTSASGVTTTTKTQVVNGKTVVTHVRHVPAYHDS